MIKGRVHSIETSGFFDGPGIRTVVFLQGCPLRCIYCHNPDTWKIDGGQEYSPDQLMERILKYKNYYRASGGGVTFSGGEPLLQADFLLTMLKACKREGINTALDTSGLMLADREKLEEILDLTDTVILDIKGVDQKDYSRMTQRKNYCLAEFIQLLNQKEKNVWLRYVHIKGYTDKEENIPRLKEILSSIKILKKFEVLPFHQMGSFKYEEEKIPYPLEGHPESNLQESKDFQEKVLSGLYCQLNYLS